jgi:hypothetical protein
VVVDSIFSNRHSASQGVVGRDGFSTFSFAYSFGTTKGFGFGGGKTNSNNKSKNFMARI